MRMLLFALLKAIIDCLLSMYSLTAYFHRLEGMWYSSLRRCLLVCLSDRFYIMADWRACRGDIREISEDHLSALHGGPSLARRAFLSDTVGNLAQFLSARLVCSAYVW